MKNKTSILLAVITLIAAFADIKYKGLFYRLLPRKVQNYLDEICK